jgi:DNA processing protein
MQISKLSYNNNKYPADLREIQYPPALLYMLGELPRNRPYVAIIGSRRITKYGKEVTYKLASELAKAGVVIVSGLAYGADGVAHQAAIEAGGLTVGVLAGGLDRIYPAGHRNLAINILRHKGALLSEYPEGTESFKSNFVARNRIVAGLCRGVIVTECAAHSGALITANYALTEGRTVMAIPGPIMSLQSAGPNNLLKQGATPVTDVTDVLAALNFDSKELQKVPVRAQSKEEQTILDLLMQGVNTTQLLIEQSKLDARQFTNIISLMEITGKVRNLGAGTWMVR